MDKKAEQLARYEIQSACIELAFRMGKYVHDFQRYSLTFRTQVVDFLEGVAKAFGEFFEETNE